ncbi:phage tail protein [uncultured Martelella sp.]|uniref:phage tail protein n=1 Tax=uncultured Martelella sp. TaxID=392331 RepID=UPI0029C697DF|nr:phage tail protein [uncultured Martelella sp.]
MADKFEPSACPAITSTKSVELRTLETRFGDGYSQRGGDGLNTTGVTFNAMWPGLTLEEADRIEAFFLSLRGFHAFEWKLPRDREAKLYRCKSWTRTGAGGAHDTINATIERVYDL